MWDIDFISKDNFRKHVKETIEKYGEKLKPVDLKQFNKNIVDPVKMLFDKNVYGSTWEEIIRNEIFRQRDKSNNNAIGYFHQRVFQYIAGCKVPENGNDGGWDIIYTNKNGIKLPDETVIHKIYVEMKNKHNTMNSAASGKTMIKMQNQLINDDDCACFLVEVIAQKSQNINWGVTVDKKKISHKLIRRVSIDKFYSLITGDDCAFYKICNVLPKVIKEIIDNQEKQIIPNDTVIKELKEMTKNSKINMEDLAIQTAIFMLGFGNYKGFEKN